ncbi:MAG: tetratricopeptide repeat protein, partial [Luteibaculum sp.]
MSAFRQIFSFSIIFLFTVLVYGQDEDIALLPDWKVKSIAKTAQLDGDHYLAIEYYEELVARQGESLEILKALADLYWLSKDYINASDAYSRLFEQEPTEGKYLLRYALLEKNLGKPASALTYLERYERKFLDQNPDPETYRLIQQEKEGCEFAINNPPNELIEIFRLPDNLNFPHVEASPVALGDSLFFSSIRINELS